MKPVTLDARKPGLLVINGTRYTGKIFHVGGHEVELYPIRVLARAIGRTDAAVRMWERHGEIPPPLFIVTGTPLQEQRRWYSRTQILNLHQAHNRFPFSTGRPHFRAPFFELVRRLWDEGDVLNVSTIRVTSFDPRPIARVERGRYAPTAARPQNRHAPENSQPGTSGGMAPEFRHRNPAVQGTTTGHHQNLQHAGPAAPRDGAHAASPDSRPESPQPAYRRRPRASV